MAWPELYDEMCAVASRGLFRGWGPDDLEAHGIKFGLLEMAALSSTVCEIVAEDRARAKTRTGAPASVSAVA